VSQLKRGRGYGRPFAPLSPEVRELRVLGYVAFRRAKAKIAALEKARVDAKRAGKFGLWSLMVERQKIRREQYLAECDRAEATSGCCSERGE